MTISGISRRRYSQLPVNFLTVVTAVVLLMFNSALQEFPSCLIFSVTLKIFLKTSSMGSNLLSAIAATLFPSHLTVPPVLFLYLILHPPKSHTLPLRPLTAPPPAQFTRGAHRNRLCSERDIFGIPWCFRAREEAGRRSPPDLCK